MLEYVLSFNALLHRNRKDEKNPNFENIIKQANHEKQMLVSTTFWKILALFEQKNKKELSPSVM